MRLSFRGAHRGTLVGALAMVFVVVSVVGLALTSGADGGARVGATRHTADALHEDEASAPAWSDAALHLECDTAPAAALGLGVGDHEEALVFDRGTGHPVAVDVRQACHDRVALTPDPGGDMTAGLSFENGAWQATYYELERTVGVDEQGRTFETVTATKELPPDEAAARLAEQKAAQARD